MNKSRTEREGDEGGGECSEGGGEGEGEKEITRKRRKKRKRPVDSG